MSIRLRMKYSIKLELQRLLNIRKRVKWYEEMDYSKRINLPQGIGNLDNLEKFSQEKIKKILEKEFNESEYQQANVKIKKNGKLIQLFFKNLENLKIKLKPHYLIVLTKYGTGGSYSRQSRQEAIFVNFFGRPIERILGVVAHEIIHLLIDPLVLKYKLEHWQKERIVDLILEKTCPKIGRTQKVPIGTKKLDKVFENFFPNIEKIVANLT